MLQRLSLFAGAMAIAAAAQATPVTFYAKLTGAAEAPPNASPATGSAAVTYDDALHTLQVDVLFAGLTSGNTASHIHCCAAAPLTASVATPVPTFPGFPTGATSGSYSRLFDLTLASSWNPTFITNNGGTPASAEAAFATGLRSGRAYLNVHTSQFPGGEIRGFLVPEPATLALAGVALLAMLAVARRPHVRARGAL